MVSLAAVRTLSAESSAVDGIFFGASADAFGDVALRMVHQTAIFLLRARIAQSQSFHWKHNKNISEMHWLKTEKHK